MLNQVEECQRQYKDNREKYQGAVFKTCAAPVLDLVENPVGNQVKKYGSNREIKNFHYRHPMQAGLFSKGYHNAQNRKRGLIQ